MPFEFLPAISDFLAQGVGGGLFVAVFFSIAISSTFAPAVMAYFPNFFAGSVPVPTAMAKYANEEKSSSEEDDDLEDGVDHTESDALLTPQTRKVINFLLHFLSLRLPLGCIASYCFLCFHVISS